MIRTVWFDCDLWRSLLGFLWDLAIVKCWSSGLELYRLAKIFARTFKIAIWRKLSNVKCRLRLQIRLDRSCFEEILSGETSNLNSLTLQGKSCLKYKNFLLQVFFYTRPEFAQNSYLTCTFCIHTFTYYRPHTVCIFYTNERPRSSENFQNIKCKLRLQFR